jgi:hypothetical protein
MQQWEYWIIGSPTVEQLNEAGAAGWELVGVAPYTARAGVAPGQYDPVVWHQIAYMKRPTPPV